MKKSEFFNEAFRVVENVTFTDAQGEGVLVFLFGNDSNNCFLLVAIYKDGDRPPLSGTPKMFETEAEGRRAFSAKTAALGAPCGR
jgi:hypothetical protein